ncbi:MAG: type IV pilus modification protein PilV [Nitrospirae bacterium]|nr:type IV pilus modification protein PilV [Nitrospirota bacterium]
MVQNVHVSINTRLLRMTTRVSRSRHEGFTLIESMIAAVILTIGLLALTGMQSFSLRKNVDANNQTRVTNLAADMLERIQFNRSNAANYQGITVCSTPSALPCVPFCPAVLTNVMANGDCTQWGTLLLSTNLQNITGTVTLSNPTPPNPDPLGLNRHTVTVQVTWNEAGSGGVTAALKTVRLDTVVAPE